MHYALAPFGRFAAALIFMATLTPLGEANNGWPPPTPFMPADQINFESDVTALGAIAREAMLGGVNPFRAKMLSDKYELLFPQVYASRNVVGWLCRYWDMFGPTMAFGPSYSTYIAITCAGENASYTLLAEQGESTSRMLADMTTGKPLKFGGAFYADIKTLHHLNMNDGIGPVIILNMPKP